MSEESRFRSYLNNLLYLATVADSEVSKDPKLKSLNISSYISLGSGIIKNASDEVIIKKFINDTNESWKFLVDKSDEGLIKAIPILVKIIPVVSINPKPIEDAIRANIITKETKDNIWVTFHRLIKVSLKYTYRMRKSQSTFAEKINLDEEATRWNITF